MGGAGKYGLEGCGLGVPTTLGPHPVVCWATVDASPVNL